MRTISGQPPRASTGAGRSADASRLPAWVGPLALGVAIAAGVVLRVVTRSELWLDEALTVNVSELPLGELHGALERDGSPPLYYVVLHFWIDVFGTSNLAVRSLSVVIGLATIVAAWFAARRISGARLGWITVLLFATSPYAIRFASEARPYGLQMLLVLLGYLALRRAFDRPGPGPLAGVAVVTSLLLYNSYWSYYLLAVAGLYVLVRAVRDPDPGPARRVLGATVVGALTFVPWIPTFLDQLAHTGTPWATPVSPPTALGRTVLEFGGGFHPEGWVVAWCLFVLLLLGVFGAARDGRRIELDLATRPLVRWEAAIAVGTLVIGAGMAWITAGAFEARYVSIMFPLFLLVVAAGVMCFADPRVRALALVVVAGVGLAGGLRVATEQRSQAVDVAAAINADAAPGDVVGFCPDQLGPAVDRLLTVDVAGLAWPDGSSPEFVDWRDYEERNEAADPAGYAELLLDAAGDDATIWLAWAGGYRTFDDSCEEVASVLSAQRPVVETRVEATDDFFEFANLAEFPAP